MGIVAVHARLLHDAGLSIAHNALSIHFGTFSGSFLSVAFAEDAKSITFKIVVGPAVFSPGEWVIAVLTHFDARATHAGQLLSDIMQESGGDAQRNSAGCRREHFVYGKVRLFD